VSNWCKVEATVVLKTPGEPVNSKLEEYLKLESKTGMLTWGKKWRQSAMAVNENLVLGGDIVSVCFETIRRMRRLVPFDDASVLSVVGCCRMQVVEKETLKGGLRC
jgi:hypothetical protein